MESPFNLSNHFIKWGFFGPRSFQILSLLLLLRILSCNLYLACITLTHMGFQGIILLVFTEEYYVGGLKSLLLDNEKEDLNPNVNLAHKILHDVFASLLS